MQLENFNPSGTQPMSEALQVLQESNGLLPALIENLPGGAVFVVDRDLRYLLAEGESLTAAGFTPEDFVGRTILEVLPPELAAKYEDYYRRALAGEPFETEHYSHNHWYITRGTPLRSPDGDVYAVLAVSFDITERKHVEDKRQEAEVALRASEERQTFLLKLSDALRSLANPVDIQEAVTQTAMSYFGADRCYYCEIEDGNAIIRRDAAREDLATVVGVYPLSSFAILQAVVDAGRPFVVQDVHTTDLVDENLRQLCIQLQMISFVDVPVIKNDKPVGVLCLVQSTPRDWTDLEVELAVETADRTWAAVERTRAEASLRESEIQRIQEQAAREQERQRAESLADLDRTKTLFFSNISHEFCTPLTLLLAPLQDALSDPTLAPIHRERLELSHRNGRRLLKLVNMLLDFSRIEAGRIDAIYEPTDLALFTTDLTSVFRSAIERAGVRLVVNCPPLPELVYLDREMWEKIVLNLLSNALKFTFSGEITVSLSAESSTNLQASTSNTHHLTSEPQHSSSELETFTSELETFTSELKPSSSELETSTFNPETFTSELQTFGSELETSTLKLEPSSSETQTSPSFTHVILQIRDTGTGIAPEHLPHLFERFYQVRGAQAHTHEGSGIGLALVHELVRFQGGEITVSSTVGEGTCFTITLPFGTNHLPPERIQTAHTLTSTALDADPYVEEAERRLSTESAALCPPSPPTLRETGVESHPEYSSAEHSRNGALDGEKNWRISRSASPAHVLLVDDNADMREYLTRILSEHVQVEAVADGIAALAAIQAQIPDLVLSDVMMPRLNGFGLLQTLRTDPRTREIPVILLSARAGEEAIAEGLNAGADDYLIKPFSAQELVSRVNAHLQISHLRGEALHEARNTIRRRDELLSVVSHELNTPLVSILGWTRLLRASPQKNPAMLSTALDTIERSATVQAKLVQDLLDVSRITVGKLRLHLQSTELESVIEAAMATVIQVAAAKGTHLIWTETATAVVMGDRERLQQVVCNLLTNAIKFTPNGGRIEVCLSLVTGHSSLVDTEELTTNDNYAEIRVTDTGIGIAADFLPHVFEQFRQAEGKNSAKGLGLGLAIARHIVELHNGTIQAQSAGLEQGTTFLVRLPLLTQATSD